MTASTLGVRQYLLLSEGLKRLPGSAFEEHDHPAVILDLASGPALRVWGWWTDGTVAYPALPCLLWSGVLGWSATVVEPDALDTEGYERAFWSHRVKLLDLALANALGPFPTVEQLELSVAEGETFGPQVRAPELTGAMLWGIRQLEAARARDRGRDPVAAWSLRSVDGDLGTIDQELVAHLLSPTFAKAAVEPGHPGLAALLAAVEAVPQEPRRTPRGLTVRQPGRTA